MGKQGLAIKRERYNELMDGFDALADEREGEITQKNHKVDSRPVDIDAGELVALRQSLGLSAVFASLFHVKYRTCQNREQGKGKPNDQAALLFKLVQNKPEMIRELQEIT